MRFSARQFLREAVGDAQSVLTLFLNHSITDVGIDTIRKWYERDSIPADRLITIIALIELDCGKPVSVVAYLL